MKNLAASDDRIIFTGFVQGRVLSELLSNCYLYVLPSDLEGMPLTLLEAMSYGQCCLVSDIPECGVEFYSNPDDARCAAGIGWRFVYFRMAINVGLSRQ